MRTPPPLIGQDTGSGTERINWRQVGMHLLVALLIIGAGVAWELWSPSLAFAQQGPADPFAEAEQKFDAFLARLKFWVWGVSAMGLAFYVIAYGGQALWPSWYGSMRDFLRNGAVLIVLFNVVFAFLIGQASAAKGSAVILLPYLIWQLRTSNGKLYRLEIEPLRPRHPNDKRDA